MFSYLLILISCAAKKTPIPPLEEPTNVVKDEKTLAPIIQKVEIATPEMPQGLPSWDDITAPSTVYQPVAGLALSHDYERCFKEWFQGDSLPPTIRKHQGRILDKEESTIGRMIQCPEERKKKLLDSLMNTP